MNREQTDKVIKEALFCTNTAYLMADIANSFAMDADSKLRKLDKELHRDEKKRFKTAVSILKDAIKATKQITEPLYQIKDVDDACNDSDFLCEVVKLVINRTDDSEESKKAMLEHIKKLPEVEHVEV